jgi:hypothetical protein
MDLPPQQPRSPDEWQWRGNRLDLPEWDESRVVPDRPPPARQRLKNRLSAWTNPGVLRGCFRLLLILGPILALLLLVLAVCLVLFLSGPLITGLFFALSRQESLANPIAEIIFALLFTLFGLALVLGTRQIQVRMNPAAPRRGLALLFSKRGRFFWIGTALCAIAAAQMALHTYANWLSILFWVVAGAVVLWPFARGLFKLLRRRKM